MSKSEKKKMIKVLCLFLVVMFGVMTPQIEVNAEESNMTESVEYLETVATTSASSAQAVNSSIRTMLVNCLMNIVCDSDGMLIEMNTDTVSQASVIGVKDIKIEKKVWYGWKTVAVADGAEDTNTNSFLCHVVYANAEVGETYRVTCTHYADVDGYTEAVHQSGEFVFTY
ncbi:MAG: hypothetical protein IJF07_09605 [Lachnospiraceae bacterium]|nr:hypothetical protein [Lachnospiraceae bacterium]